LLWTGARRQSHLAAGLHFFVGVEEYRGSSPT